MTRTDRTIDLSGLTCPMPLLRTKAALAQMESGQVLNVIGTDPGSPRELKNFARQSGHTIIDLIETDNRYHCLIRKG